MKFLLRLLLLSAYLLACGGHWYVAQLYAWGTMLQANCEVMPFQQAIERTFSGKYPCKMCQAIAEKKQKTEQMDFLDGTKKCKESLPVLIVLVGPIPCCESNYFQAPNIMLPRTEAPPVPPPRLS